MPQLSSSNFIGFLERFYHCHDGVVRDVRVHFATKKVMVILSVQDRETQENEGWVNLTLEIKDLVEFILIEGKSTCAVISDTLQIGFFDGAIYVDFCPYTEAPRGIDDFRKSLFLVAGKRCVWSVSSYDDTILNADQKQSAQESLPRLMRPNKPGTQIVLDSLLGQRVNVFNPLTYREFLERQGHAFQEYSRLYDLHLTYKTPQERFESPERAQMQLLKEQFGLLRQEYFQRLPIHLLARCPYCDAPVLQPVDSFSLIGFYPLLNVSELYRDPEWSTGRPPRQRCQHAVLVTLSVNLNGLMPDDLPTWALQRRWLKLDSAPRVMVWPLIARQTSAVIGALPIGRLDDPEPIHRYTAYFVTYFAGDATNLYTEEMWVPTDLGGPATDGVHYDLDLLKWVKAGRLFWLNPDDPSQLINAPAEAFPYANIQPQGWYEIVEGGRVDGPHPYHQVWQGDAPRHDESFPKTIE